jgi:hypothetical protein
MRRPKIGCQRPRNGFHPARLDWKSTTADRALVYPVDPEKLLHPSSRSPGRYTQPVPAALNASSSLPCCGFRLRSSSNADCCASQTRLTKFRGRWCPRLPDCQSLATSLPEVATARRPPLPGRPSRHPAPQMTTPGSPSVTTASSASARRMRDGGLLPSWHGKHRYSGTCPYHPARCFFWGFARVRSDFPPSGISNSVVVRSVITVHHALARVCVLKTSPRNRVKINAALRS